MCASQASTRLYVGLLTCAFLLTCSTPLLAAATQVYVANNGTDTPGCGAQDHPCRSITRGIANVSAGGTVVVGPGRYGDLNSDGKFDYPGEEHPQSITFTSPGSGQPLDMRCVVCITKPLRLLSRAGAESTIIDAGHALYNAVEVVVNSVTIGDVGRGFTLMNAGFDQQAGLGGSGLRLWGGPARITGNLATQNDSWGFDLVPGGEGLHGLPGPFWVNGPVTAAGNTSIANGGGFNLESFSTDISLSNALAVGNDGLGLRLVGSGRHSVTGSKINGNGLGVQIQGGPFRLTHNYIVANRGTAVFAYDRLELFPPEANTLTNNAIIGNDTGFDISFISVSIMANRNNIFGNGTDGSNCAITIEFTGVNARNNYWGSPKGPGPDPADWWGQEPLCNGTIPNNDAAVFDTPFSKDPFPIN